MAEWIDAVRASIAGKGISYAETGPAGAAAGRTIVPVAEGALAWVAEMRSAPSGRPFERPGYAAPPGSDSVLWRSAFAASGRTRFRTAASKRVAALPATTFSRPAIIAS